MASVIATAAEASHFTARNRCVIMQLFRELQTGNCKEGTDHYHPKKPIPQRVQHPNNLKIKIYFFFLSVSFKMHEAEGKL